LSLTPEIIIFKVEKYTVRDDLIKWCKREAEKAGFTRVIEKSDNGSHKRKMFFVLGCKRDGEYKKPKKKIKER
jgi:hypothetical protein